MTKHTQTCTYIGGGEGCTHTAIEGRSYCEQHYALVYQRGTARARRKKDLRRAHAIWDLQSAFNDAVAELEAEGFDCFGDTDITVKELEID
jgi:hypothetical protein